MHLMNRSSLKVSFLNTRLLDNHQKYVSKSIEISHWRYDQIKNTFASIQKVVIRIIFRSFLQLDLQARGSQYLNKDPTVWLNGAKPPPKVFLQVKKYISKSARVK